MGLRVFAFASLVAAVAGGQQPPTFRSTTNTVSLYATVRGNDGRLVPDLTRDDFEVLDNSQPQVITVFRGEVVPITVAVMFDTSGSMYRRLPLLRAAGEAFIERLLPADRARIGSFGREIAISPRLTGDHEYLRRVVNRELWIDGETPLWRAVDGAMSSMEGEPGRRVVLVVSDGADTTGRSPASVAMRARREGFMVYAVGLVDQPARNQLLMGSIPAEGGSAKELRLLALDTGGGFVRPDGPDDLAPALARVADELHSQYVLGFTPQTLDGKTHRLEVAVKRSGYSVQARRSYVAEIVK